MEKHTEIYYKSKDGTKFATEEECAAYESEEKRYKTAINKKKEAERELAIIEYERFKRNGGFPGQTIGCFGCDHDGYYSKCPHCGEMTGNYDRKNLGLKVDKNIYKCEKCGKFFSYS